LNHAEGAANHVRHKLQEVEFAGEIQHIVRHPLFSTTKKTSHLTLHAQNKQYCIYIDLDLMNYKESFRYVFL
jgi:hypothetical protein